VATGRRIVARAWAFPATLIGLVLALLVVATGGQVRIVDGVVEAADGALAGWLRPRARFCAITFGHVVLALDRDTHRRCRAHERVHVRQYERWGAVFLVAYVGSSLWQRLRGRDAYRDNRFEREARRIAGL
jgi:heme A synthase